jgi:SHS2 domain-containing protein
MLVAPEARGEKMAAVMTTEPDPPPAPPERGKEKKGRHEHFAHGADVGVRGFGASASEAFEQAAVALFALLAEQPESVREKVEERIEIEAPTPDELLVAFLNELISVADARHLVFGRFAVRVVLGPTRSFLSARAWGETFDPERHDSTVQPKGATFTALRVAAAKDGWVAQCVVDV